ncbi:hypothetical protein [Ideonella alba]|nr:hypothetical protein [Ideonella alba]
MHDLTHLRAAPRTSLAWWLLAMAVGALECLALARSRLQASRRSR